jgi:hypothetical protein
VGTLDSLISLSDDLAKIDTFVEVYVAATRIDARLTLLSVVFKLAQYLSELSENKVSLIVISESWRLMLVASEGWRAAAGQ